MKKTLLISAFGLLILAGCQTSSPGTTGSTTGASSGSTSGTTDQQPEVATPISGTDAFSYLGLGRQTEYSYVYTALEGGEAAAGTQLTKLVSADDKAAKFQITRGGSLDILGSETIEARPDGVYQITMAQGQLKSPALVMPAKIAVGQSWDSSFEMTSAGTTSKFEVTNKVVANEKVKVKAGEFDAIKISQTGSMTRTSPPLPGDATAKATTVKTTLSSESWYAKGVGNLKMVITLKQADGKTVKQTVELTSTGEKKPAEGAAKTP